VTEAVTHRVPFHRTRHVIRVTIARTAFLVMSTRLLRAAWRGQLKEIWVGDSHAALIPATELGAPLRHIEDGRWVCHLGPRLQFSIARQGLPPAVLRIFGLVGRTKHAKDVLWVYSFGEIDVRCHLVPRMEEPGTFDFVPAYLERIRESARATGSDRALVLVPPPESDVAEEQIGFPVVGNLEERTRALHLLRDAMHKAAASMSGDGPEIILIDVIDQFSDELGVWRQELTYDGLHTNDAGRAIVRQEINRLLAAAGPAR
jgi:acid stress-induced BolA-like protein IbaG/YrbA